MRETQKAVCSCCKWLVANPIQEVVLSIPLLVTISRIEVALSRDRALSSKARLALMAPRLDFADMAIYLQ